MTRRATKVIGAAALVVAGLSPAADAAPPAVAGETVVVVQGATKMRITLPQRAYVSLDAAKSLDIDGGGRLVGLLLRENHPQAEEAMFFRAPEQLKSRKYVWGPTAQTGCKESEAPGVLPDDCSAAKTPTHVDLRRGSYTLYAFSDGGPARVTLRFANYRGRTVLTPRTPVDHAAATFAPGAAAPVSWSGGASVRADGPGLLFSAAWWKQDDSVAANAGSCWYDGRDGLPGPYKWVPGCPAGSSAGWSEVATPLTPAWGPAKGGQTGSIGLTWPNKAGTYGVGAWAIAQNVRDGGGFVYWLGR